jgi:hypothetical protein
MVDSRCVAKDVHTLESAQNVADDFLHTVFGADIYGEGGRSPPHLLNLIHNGQSNLSRQIAYGHICPRSRQSLALDFAQASGTADHHGDLSRQCKEILDHGYLLR